MTKAVRRFPFVVGAALLAAAVLAPLPASALGQLSWECRDKSGKQEWPCFFSSRYFDKVGCTLKNTNACKRRGDYWVCAATSEKCYRTFNGVCPTTHKKLTGPAGFGTICKDIGAAAEAPAPSKKWGKALLWSCKDGGGDMDGSDYNINTAGECFTYAKKKTGALGCKVTGGGCQRAPGASSGNDARPNFTCSMQSPNCFSGSYDDCGSGWHQRSTAKGGVCVKGAE